MGKSDLLRVHDVRDAYRLIGECRDLGREPTLWFPRMIEGVGRLIGACAVTGGEGRWHPGVQTLDVLSACDAGMDEHARERYAAFMREQGPLADPTFRLLVSEPGPAVTYIRQQLVPDAVWFRTIAYNEYRRPANADRTVMSLYHVSRTKSFCLVTPIRGIRERDFSPREVRLLNFFVTELGPLIGKSLVAAGEHGPATLSPRLRQTLACLIEGDSEKQVAARLSLSPATTHQYVTMLYRHFGVRSRAELLAHVIKRIGRQEWRLFLTAASGLSAEGGSEDM